MYYPRKPQNSSQNVLNGKIKGLFCCVSVETFFNFSVYGLYSQSLISKSTHDLQSLAREVFSPVWYAGEAAQGVPMNRDTSYLAKVSGFAAKRSTLFDKPIALRFSRFSSVSQIKEYDPEELQNGVFLSLCRVLILHQRSVVGPITDTDIQEALAMNYDSVYSTLT